MTAAMNKSVGGFSFSFPGVRATPNTRMTRPADTNVYAVGDAIANSTTASSVTSLMFVDIARGDGHYGVITGAKLVTSDGSMSGSVRLHLFNQAPFTTGGYQADNAALAITDAALTTSFQSLSGILNNYVGYFDFTTWLNMSSVSVSAAVGVRPVLPFQPAYNSATIYGLLEARTAFTPISAQTFLPIIDVQQD